MSVYYGTYYSSTVALYSTVDREPTSTGAMPRAVRAPRSVNAVFHMQVIVSASPTLSHAGRVRRRNRMPAERPSRASTLFLGARCALYMLPWLAHLLLADIALSALLPVSALFPDACYNLSSRIAETVWRGIQRIFTRVNRANITISGAAGLPTHESAILISNHVQWTDFYMIQELALRSGMLGRCRW